MKNLEVPFPDNEFQHQIDQTEFIRRLKVEIFLLCQEYKNMSIEELDDVTPFDVLNKVSKCAGEW